MDEAYAVKPYSITSLLDLLVGHSEASLSQIRAKPLASYFDGYFAKLDAKTIVVEKRYVDRDFLDDYAQYYVRCFQDYNRKCSRLHFFRLGFCTEDFHALLLGRESVIDEDALQKAYLGFVVVKPLPLTVVGRTCLEVYPHEGRRYFPVTRAYNVNLFGIPLTVTKTIAFQEQDTVVAACATSALWSVFQATGMLFHHSLPSPSQITRAATEPLAKDSRVFPSRGLDSVEMAKAIQSVTLEPYAISVSDLYVLRSTVYAYLKAQIPLILGLRLFDSTFSPPHEVGLHAVAVTGFSLGLNGPKFSPTEDFAPVAARMDKLYVHDDQIGPFARMVLEDKEACVARATGKIEQVHKLSTSWCGKDGATGSIFAEPILLLVPLYHKVRITFERIHDIVFHFNSFLNALAQLAPSKLEIFFPLEWEVFLTTVNDFKKELFTDDALAGDQRHVLLVRDMPRYLWRATGRRAETKIIDLLFDATDIEQAEFFFEAVVYERTVENALKAFACADSIQDTYAQTEIWPILRWFQSRGSGTDRS